MTAYLITTIHSDGQRAQLHGLFANDWDALDAALALSSNPKRVSVRRLS